MNWIDISLQALAKGERSAIVTVVRAVGSTPRETGAKLVVLENSIHGSIGGGQMEFQAIEVARQMLEAGGAERRLIPQVLGPDLGQCCGGAVYLLVETIGAADRAWLIEAMGRCRGEVDSWLQTPETGPKFWLDAKAAQANGWTSLGMAGLSPGDSNWRVIERIRQEHVPVFLFGAGHVGRALATILSALPFESTWIDSRDDGFPQQLPAGVMVRKPARAAEMVASAPAGTIFLVMTHSHELDFEICDQILRRGDFAFLGLIGSATKRARFAHRLKERGFTPAQLDRLVCPIGLSGVPGKEPMAIAVAVAGHLLALREGLKHDQNDWRAHVAGRLEPGAA